MTEKQDTNSVPYSCLFMIFENVKQGSFESISLYYCGLTRNFFLMVSFISLQGKILKKYYAWLPDCP